MQPRPDGKGKALKQVVTTVNIEWHKWISTSPYSLIGSLNWRNYEVSCDVYIQGQGHAGIFARSSRGSHSPFPAWSYWLKIDCNDTWEISDGNKPLASGTIVVDPNTWHNIKLILDGSSIVAAVDGKKIGQIKNSAHANGMAGLCSGKNVAYFDNFCVASVDGKDIGISTENIAKGAVITASSQFGNGFGPEKAFDGNYATRWNALDNKEQWVEAAFNKPETFNTVVLTPFLDRIKGFSVQILKDNDWKTVYHTNKASSNADTIKFDRVTTSKLRVLITKTGDKTASLYELEVYDVPDGL